MTLAEQRTERLARQAEINERNRRIFQAAEWAERHRITPVELLQAVDTARALKTRLGRPLSLAEIADCLPPPKGPK